MTTRVTRVQIDHDVDHVAATITVDRVLSPYTPPGSPDVNDVPRDILEALRTWLDGAR